MIPIATSARRCFRDNLLLQYQDQCSPAVRYRRSDTLYCASRRPDRMWYCTESMIPKMTMSDKPLRCSFRFPQELASRRVRTLSTCGNACAILRRMSRCTVSTRPKPKVSGSPSCCSRQSPSFHQCIPRRRVHRSSSRAHAYARHRCRLPCTRSNASTGSTSDTGTADFRTLCTRLGYPRIPDHPRCR